MRRILLCAAVALSLCAPAVARTLDYADLRAIVNVGDPQISPDGTRVIYMKSRADFEKDRSVSEIMLANLRTGAQRALTFERRGIGSPRWSPDGSKIAFLGPQGEGKDRHQQIFVMRMDGGDAAAVSHFDEDVQTYAWSPDGTRFAAIVQDKNPNEKQIENHLDAFEVGDNDYLHEAAAIPSHLWVVNAHSGKAKRLTSGSFSLATVDPDGAADPSWSRSGDAIAFVRLPTPLIGDSLGGIIEVVDVATGRIRKVTANKGLEGSPMFSPSSGAIAYSRSAKGDATNGNAVYVQTGNVTRDLRGSIDRNIDGAVWAADGKAMWLSGHDGTHDAVWYAPLSGAPLRVNLSGFGVSTLGNVAKNGTLALILNTPAHPSEVYILRSPKAKPQRVSNWNTRFASLDLGRVTSLSWKSTKGNFHPDGVLTYPAQYKAGKRYPLVLLVHGGPQSASVENWSSRRQIFASHGYFVFEPNYRGSTNLGDAYQHAIAFDAGDGPGQDVMSGVEAVKRLGVIDESRIAVTGWSYGGYMTSWLIGHYHIWKAAMSGAALNDWLDDYNVSFYVDTDVPYFGGKPWNPKYTKMWIEQSPITYAEQIKTPTLIMGDIGDNNVTITNSFKMYHALKDNGVPVEFVAYPVHGHYPGDPVRSEDVTRRWLGWLDKYLK